MAAAPRRYGRGVVEDAIREAVAELLPGATVLAIEPMAGGVSADVRRVDVRARDGRTLHLVSRRTDPGADGAGIDVEHAVLAHVASHGIPVARPLHLVDGAGGPLLLLEHVVGTTTPAPGEVPGALVQLADVVARLHALDVADGAVPGLRAIEDPVGGLLGCLDADPPAAGLPVGRALADLRRALLDVAAGDRPAVRSALLHGDVWPGNALWRDGRLVALLDWEDACLGDPMADLACARIELACAHGDSAAASFTDAYLEASARRGAPPVTSSLALWEAYSAAAALDAMGSWGLPPAEEAHRREVTSRRLAGAAARLIAAGGPEVP